MRNRWPVPEAARSLRRNATSVIARGARPINNYELQIMHCPIGHRPSAISTASGGSYPLITNHLVLLSVFSF